MSAILQRFRRALSGCQVVIAFIILLQLDGVACSHEMSDVERLLIQASNVKKFVPATRSDLDQCEELFRRTFVGPRDETLVTDWKVSGWRLRQLSIDGHDVFVVYEDRQHLRGWGFYVIVPDRLPGVALQAPHSFADELSRELALLCMAEGSFATCAWNTVRRDRIDVAHQIDHPFSSFTKALIESQPEAYVIQLHGFAQEKRKTPQGTVSDLIISNGDRFPAPAVRKAAVLMQTNFPYGRVRLYPQEINELGATTNVQGELLRQHSSDRFIHFEMSRPLRNKLLSDATARTLFLKNLNRVVEE
ncbi:MAG: hypothetical protein KDA92_06030 [Planctomycetales bacterium]|nr:hypothetical protein [Planctomycetales bacterium]